MELMAMKQTPNWFKRSAVYQINPRTFSEEGTIKAVTAARRSSRL